MPPPPARDALRADGRPTAESASWRALGTLVQLVVTDPRCLAEARRMLTADLAEVDLACSRFRADSEICALRTADGRPARISPLLAEAIAVALRAAQLTDGDVDPTVGAAMSAVGYDRDFEQIQRTGPVSRAHRQDGARLARSPPGRPVPDHAGRGPARPGGDREGVGRRPVRRADRARLGCGVLVSLGGDIAVAGPPPRAAGGSGCRT